MDLLANLSKWPFWIDSASVVVIAAGVAKAFEWFDGLISDDSRVALWYHLADIPSDEKIDSWGEIFPKLVDRVFGEKALSMKFFRRSCIASVLAVALCCCADFSFRAMTSETLDYELLLQYSIVSPLLILILGVYALAFNLLPDYLSLLISRFVIKLVARRKENSAIVLLLLGDLIATGALAFLAISVTLKYVHVLLSHLIVSAPIHQFITHDLTIQRLFQLSAFLPMVVFGGGGGFQWFRYSNPLPWINFFSAFFTSIWLWLYVLSIFLIKAAHKFRPLWLKLLPWLDIEKSPMKSIGRFAGILAGAGYALILVLVWVSKHWG
jgi:hypothetical protein